MRLSERRIVLGVTGGIAAYKAVELLRLLRRDGATVHVVMTRSARRFVTPLTFAALTDQPVLTGMFDRSRPMSHVDLSRDSDLIAVVPATANIIGKFCAGIGDDLLSTLLLARRGPVLFAPAMNEAMWRNPVVEQNRARLQALGAAVVEPTFGDLACGEVGTGRMAEPAAIHDRIIELLTAPRRLAGRRVVVSCGRTEEPLDAVRVVTNRASGRLGFALARACQDQGAAVVLVCGETSVPPPGGFEIVRVRTGAELAAALAERTASADLLFMVAAVADYRPERPVAGKRHEKVIDVRLTRTEDILAGLVARGTTARVVAFSVDEGAAVTRARQKLRTKGADVIVANPVSAIGAARSSCTLLFRSGRQLRLPAAEKGVLAARIVDAVAREFF